MKEYKLYKHITSSDAQGFYKAEFVGQGKGCITKGLVL